MEFFKKSLLFLAIASNSYATIYQAQIWERKLADGRIQRLYTGGDIHIISEYERGQITHIIQHIRKKRPSTSRVIIESHIPAYCPLSIEMYLLKCDRFIENYFLAPILSAIHYITKRKNDVVIPVNIGFLQSLHRCCLRENISESAIDFRLLTYPFTLGFLHNNHKLNDVIYRIDQYITEFKQDGINKKILTNQDFTEFERLKNRILLSPTGEMSVTEFFKHEGCSLIIDPLKGYPQAPEEAKELFKACITVLDNRALYEVCSDTQHDELYLFMGGLHIDNLKKRLSQQGWMLFGDAGMTIAEMIEQEKIEVILFSAVFADLPKRSARVKTHINTCHLAHKLLSSQ